MIKSVKMTKKSGNTNFFNIKYQNLDRYYPIKIVDNSGVTSPKRILIYHKDEGSGYEAQPPVWKEFHFNDLINYKQSFDFFGTYSVGGFYDGNFLFEVDITLGKKYQLNSSSNCFELMGDASSGSKFQFYNNKSSNIDIRIKRSGTVCAKKIATVGSTIEFSFKPTFWIGATSDMINNPDISLINTEISLLGVGSCDVVASYSGVYSFSLANITFA